ncbi:DUF4276 family protein [Burkholderia cenocepacia]|nr:DUF4276 family protein [Burkholderia cenocepacia]
MTWIVLATEDELSEQVGLCLAAEAGLDVGQRLRKNGNGYLRSRIPNFCQMAQQQPVFLITDLDQSTSASSLIADWFGQTPCPANFLFRIAIREVEAWLLADHDAIRALFGRRVGRLPDSPDNLPDPKQALLALADLAPRRIREEVVVKRGSVASQGIGYNPVLCAWVRDTWQASRAAGRSPSLARTIDRLQELADR